MGCVHQGLNLCSLPVILVFPCWTGFLYDLHDVSSCHVFIEGGAVPWLNMRPVWVGAGIKSQEAIHDVRKWSNIICVISREWCITSTWVYTALPVLPVPSNKLLRCSNFLSTVLSWLLGLDSIQNLWNSLVHIRNDKSDGIIKLSLADIVILSDYCKTGGYIRKIESTCKYQLKVLVIQIYCRFL